MKANTQLSIYVIMASTILMIILQSCLSATEVTKVKNYNAKILISWNEKVYRIAQLEDKFLTLKGLRTASMMHIAVHDVLNSINPQYSHYSYNQKTPMANPISGAVQAAYEVVVSQYPDKQKELKIELDAWLKKINNDTSKENGIELGKKAARSILKKRQNDSWNDKASYIWHPMAPGVYAEFNEHSGTPEGFIFGAGWAKAEPFLLENQDQFRSPPPPDIDSEDYTKAFNEVKEYGSSQSTKRTKDQAHLAMWWKDFVENSHNRLARKLVLEENLNLWEAARVFALMNMTIYDAYISVFDNKFYYNHWRPYTAIRWAANDKNSNTEPDLNWNNLHKHTYAFPSYPSAHGTASSAAMKVLSNVLGKGDNYKFIMITKEVNSAGPFSDNIRLHPSTRSFNSFSEAGLEASMSRVYLGIHFRYDSEEGHILGNKIGAYVNQKFLKKN